MNDPRERGRAGAASFASELEQLCRKHGITQTVRVELGAGDYTFEFAGLNDAERLKWVFSLWEYPLLPHLADLDNP